MTRKEEIENAIKSNAPCFGGVNDKSYLMTDGEIEASYSGFRKGVEWADKNPKSPWISVKDDLPCNHKELIDSAIPTYTLYVLVIYKDGTVYLSRMVKTSKGNWIWLFGVSHWMPIPKLPKE